MAETLKNSISETFKTHNHSNLIFLDFNSISQLPESHAWTPESDSADPFLDDSVPVIDPFDPNALSHIRHACENWGVFQVTNHGIQSQLLSEVEHQSRRLFSLPADQKLRAARSLDAGIKGYGMSTLSPHFEKQMWSESFSIIGSPEEHAAKLWPDDHAKFCNVMEEYQREMDGLSQKLMNLILGSLGLTLKDMEWAGSNTYKPLLQLNSYPVCPDPDRAMGLGPHTDSSFITLLYQSKNTNGLEVYKEGIGWVKVHPIANALVVIVADMTHILTNGRVKSVLHRATVNKTRHRISAAYVHGPPENMKISPLMKLVDHDHSPLYPPMTWSEFLSVKKAHYNNHFEFIKIDI
ncbi:hypothetical protein UlMin_022319 [Ulmus minor]